MYCRYCGTKLEDENPICPGCGRDSEEKPAAVPVQGSEEAIVFAETAQAAPKPKRRGLLIGVAIAACVLLLAGIGAGAWYFINDGWMPKPNDVNVKDSYSVSDDEAVKNADVVVATMGDRELTNGELQIYYWMSFYNFVEQYSDYLGSYVSLDVKTPLDQQVMDDGETTWQKYFLEAAVGTWKQYTALYNGAKQAGYTLNAELSAELEGLPAKLESQAVDAGFAGAQEMLNDEMGAGCTVEDYMHYMETYYFALQYFNDYYESLSPTEDEVKTYFTEHASDYEYYGVALDNDVLVDVRHILVIPEGGKSESGGAVTYTDDAWEACRVKAQGILDGWLAGEKTEEAFAALANEKSEDSGSNTIGGIYTYVHKGQMLTEFNDWCFDASRKPGDHGLVKTTAGYHIMYFVGSTPEWYVYGLDGLKSELSDQFIDEKTEADPAKVNYKKMILGVVDFSS